MTTPASGEVTQLLLQWRGGDEQALAQLVPLVYDELRRLARHYLRHERPGHTMQTGTLVHEAFLRLVQGEVVDWQDRAHFYGIAAQVMRRVLIETVRSRQRQKRGGGWTRVALVDELAIAGEPAVDLLALNEALEWLAQRAPRKAQVVELRFFGGLTIEETAVALRVSTDTVKSDWGTAKLWLMRRLNGEEARDGTRAL